jgi:hypothetical protein
VEGWRDVVSSLKRLLVLSAVHVELFACFYSVWMFVCLSVWTWMGWTYIYVCTYRSSDFSQSINLYHPPTHIGVHHHPHRHETSPSFELEKIIPRTGCILIDITGRCLLISMWYMTWLLFWSYVVSRRSYRSIRWHGIMGERQIRDMIRRRCCGVMSLLPCAQVTRNKQSKHETSSNQRCWEWCDVMVVGIGRLFHGSWLIVLDDDRLPDCAFDEFRIVFYHPWTHYIQSGCSLIPWKNRNQWNIHSKESDQIDLSMPWYRWAARDRWMIVHMWRMR